MKIARVFPVITKYSPSDAHVYNGPPSLLSGLEDYDEIHISCIFTWHLERARWLVDQWELQYPGRVRLGGPAVPGDVADEFTPGRYLKRGVTTTSRGCPNKCRFCLVPEREGRIRTLNQIHPGHLVQDNNLLACPREHRARVYQMLRGQQGVRFIGGLESRRLTQWDVDEMRSIPGLASLHFACDAPRDLLPLRRALDLCRGVFPREMLRCFVMVAFDPAETVDDAEERLHKVIEAGAYPFVQLYQPPGETKRRFSSEWRDLRTRYSSMRILRTVIWDIEHGRDPRVRTRGLRDHEDHESLGLFAGDSKGNRDA